MKDYINQVLGNSLRCILPSYWWKRLLGMLSDKVDSAQSSADNAQRLVALVASEFGNKQDKLVSGSNIMTINGTSLLGSGNMSLATWKLNKYDSEEDLANNGSDVGGEIATVVDKKYIDKSFSECYKPQSSESGSYNAKFTRVSGITLKSTFGFSSIPSNYNWFRLKLISDGKSKGYYKEYPYDIEIEWGYWYSDRIMCWERDASGSGTGHTIFTSSGRDENSIALVNKILENGDFRFLCLQVKTTNGTFSSLDNNLPDDAYAMIDRVVNMRYAETINADIYVRSAEWVKLLKKGDVTGGGADIVVDSELSDTSENPVQNKAIKAYVDGKVANAEGGSLSINELDITSHAQIQGIIAKVREGEHDIYWVGSDTQSSSCLSYYIYDDLSLFVVTDDLCMSIFDLQGNKVLVDTKYRIYGSADASTANSRRIKKNSVMYRMIADGLISGADCYLHYADNGKDYKVNQCEMTTVGSTTYLCLSAVGDGIIIKHRMLNSGQYYDSTTGPLISFDSELSETSENAVQNKAVTEALNAKADRTYVDEQIESITNEILDNEEVVAAALNNLNERVSQPKHIVFNLGADQSVNKEAYDAFFSADGFPSVSVIAGDKASFEMYPVYGVSGANGEPLSLSVLSVNDGTVSMTRYIVSSNGSILIGQ